MAINIHLFILFIFMNEKILEIGYLEIAFQNSENTCVLMSASTLYLRLSSIRAGQPIDLCESDIR